MQQQKEQTAIFKRIMKSYFIPFNIYLHQGWIWCYSFLQLLDSKQLTLTMWSSLEVVKKDSFTKIWYDGLPSAEGRLCVWLYYRLTSMSKLGLPSQRMSPFVDSLMWPLKHISIHVESTNIWTWFIHPSSYGPINGNSNRTGVALEDPSVFTDLPGSSLRSFQSGDMNLNAMGIFTINVP